MKKRLFMLLLRVLAICYLMVILSSDAYGATKTKNELVYDVVSAQIEASMYIMSVDQGATEYSMRVDQGYQMNIRNACLALTDGYDSRWRCKMLVCYYTGIPFSQCLDADYAHYGENAYCCKCYACIICFPFTFLKTKTHETIET